MVMSQSSLGVDRAVGAAARGATGTVVSAHFGSVDRLVAQYALVQFVGIGRSLVMLQESEAI